MHTVMIFGASGFLGSALANSLSRTFNVIAVVRPESDTWRLNTDLKALITEPTENWKNLVKSYKPKTVICAQWNGTEIRYRENSELQESNVIQIEGIAQVARDERVSTFIAFGSQAETSKTLKFVPEQLIQNPASAYGAMKIKLLLDLNELFMESESRFIWARVFSIFGPMEIGETLIPNLIRAKCVGEPLIVNNPTLQWSYLYIDDFTSAIEKLIETKEISGVVNIGNDELVTIESICKMISNGSYTSKKETTMKQEGYFPILDKLKRADWRPALSLEESLKISADGIFSNLTLRNLL